MLDLRTDEICKVLLVEFVQIVVGQVNEIRAVAERFQIRAVPVLVRPVPRYRTLCTHFSLLIRVRPLGCTYILRGEMLVMAT